MKKPLLQFHVVAKANSIAEALEVASRLAISLAEVVDESLITVRLGMFEGECTIDFMTSGTPLESVCERLGMTPDDLVQVSEQVAGEERPCSVRGVRCVTAYGVGMPDPSD